MDGPSAATPGRGVGVRGTGTPPGLSTEDGAGEVTDGVLEDLILRGHALYFLPGPLFDDRPAVATGS